MEMRDQGNEKFYPLEEGIIYIHFDVGGDE